ncbi:helix-turn-helix domain-containing protein [Gimesia maris]|uniref:helix-turn-helix domain-containing protein n=1 Tax=Gimesia maris TaxID=122 RepID=UPI003A8D267F
MLIYSNERRLEVLKAYAAGLTTWEIALQFQCSESWVRQVKPELRDQEKPAPPSGVNEFPSGLQWQIVFKLQSQINRISLCRN